MTRRKGTLRTALQGAAFLAVLWLPFAHVASAGGGPAPAGSGEAERRPAPTGSGKDGEKKPAGDSERPAPSDTSKEDDATTEVRARPAPKPTVAAGDVVFGNAAVFSTPAEVDVDKVFEAIPEYREIREKQLGAGDARHALLIGKASRRFRCSLKKAAKAAGYDLVARRGTVKSAAEVPDITQDVIDRL